MSDCTILLGLIESAEALARTCFGHGLAAVALHRLRIAMADPALAASLLACLLAWSEANRIAPTGDVARADTPTQDLD